MNSHYLFPGKLAAFDEETIISTLLGSCVAVALYDPVAKVGGLNHYLLPEGGPHDCESSRYGKDAIPMLVEECVRLGAEARRLQAKIYGGGNVISVSSLGEAIGKRNIDLAEKLLAQLRIPIIERNVGGEHARTIKMNSANFEVLHNSRFEGNSETPVDVSGFRPLQTASLQTVKVLVVDDSATVRTLFTKIFSSNGLEVVGAAADAYQAREIIVQKKPDVITLDIEMPKMSGVMFLEKIMKHQPIPTVMVSSLASTGEAALKALELGAIEFVHKPSQFDPAVLRDLAETLVSKVRAAAAVNILRKLKETPNPIAAAGKTTVSAIPRKRAAELKVITVGGNAGSVEALSQFLSGLAADTPPVVIACSTVTHFLEAFVTKIRGRCKVSLNVAKDNEALRMASVYFIPADHHGRISAGALGPVLKLEKGAPVASQIPSSNVLFKSAAQAYQKGVYAVLLGGFGSDGVDGLGEVQAKGGVSVVQHPEEAEFPFGPQTAIQKGLADEILGADVIAKHLMQYRNQNLY
jgi:two-component system chemotaxis response regulator CheB